MRYPDTRIEEVPDTLAGVPFLDSYRWLEGAGDDVQQWKREQANLASAHVQSWPHFERLRQLVTRFSTGRPEISGGLPRFSAGQWFRTRVANGASQAQAVVANSPMGAGRVLFDPLTENAECPPYLSWIAPSPDGRILALGVCPDGSEHNTVRLIDVQTGERLPGPPSQRLMDSWTSGAQWLSDSSGFFFNALTGAVDLEQQVYLHRRFPTPTTIPVDIAWTEARGYRTVVVSRDGRYAIALERLRRTIPVAVAALDQGPLGWRPFITQIKGTVAGHVVGERYIAVTDVGAPRGRLVAIPLDADNPNDPQSWQELAGESEAVLRTVTPVGEVLYLTEYVDTYARVRIVSLDGRELGDVPLPGRGAVHELPFVMSNLVPKGHPDQFLFAFSTLTVSPGMYRHIPAQVEIETLQAPSVRIENTVVEDRSAVSADGTRVPYRVVRRADIDASKPQPTLIYGYGGFNYPFTPQFPGPMAAFVAAGGTYVHAHLRGGGELGLEWWQGGRTRNKQNCYDDLYAIAEDLIAAKRSIPQLLAVTGGSNGGLMASVAAMQRPDLWAVSVPRVPTCDLIGHCRYPYVRMAFEELADVEDPAEVHRLASFSPYHLVQDGVRYPAIFIVAGATDPRTPAWEACKFAARLQRASRGGAPILIHVWENAGHGWATDKHTALAQNTEWLAFTMRYLGMTWERSLETNHSLSMV